MESVKYAPDVVITAGGTREKIDDVRYIGNFSGGRLGFELVKSYRGMGYEVALLAPRSVTERFGEIDGVKQIDYCTAEDLDESIRSISATQLFLHSAAVSDYKPVKVEGKISSDQDELTLHLKRTSKILPRLREQFGPSTKIVGFKLLSGVTEMELVDVATSQISNCGTDLCIANDLKDIGHERRLHIVEANGTYETLLGTTSAVAAKISSTIGVSK